MYLSGISSRCASHGVGYGGDGAAGDPRGQELRTIGAIITQQSYLSILEGSDGCYPHARQEIQVKMCITETSLYRMTANYTYRGTYDPYAIEKMPN